MADKPSWTDLWTLDSALSANRKLGDMKDAMQRQAWEAAEDQARLRERLDAMRDDAEASRQQAHQERESLRDKQQAVFEARQQADALAADTTLTPGQRFIATARLWDGISDLNERDFDDLAYKKLVSETKALVQAAKQQAEAAFPDRGYIWLINLSRRRSDALAMLMVGYKVVEKVEKWIGKVGPGREIKRGNQAAVGCAILYLFAVALTAVILVFAGGVAFLFSMTGIVALLLALYSLHIIRSNKHRFESETRTRADAVEDFRDAETFAEFAGQPQMVPHPWLDPKHMNGRDLGEIRDRMHELMADARKTLATLDGYETETRGELGALLEQAPAMGSYDLASESGAYDAAGAEVERRDALRAYLDSRYEDTESFRPKAAPQA